MEAAGGSGAGALRWRFGQCFGEKDADEEFAEADVLSAIEFDGSGDFLATGDKGGRIVIFERADDCTGRKRPRAAAAGGERERERERAERDDADMNGGAGSEGAEPEYRFLTEFQSHESEFDYLKSLEIEEKINQVAWCKRTTGSLLLLSTNDKTIKLWKIHDKCVHFSAGLPACCPAPLGLRA